VTNGSQTVDSNTITVNASAAGAGVTGAHGPATQGYIAGRRVRIHQTVTYTGNVSRLDLAVLLPAGWSFVTSDDTAATTKPTAGVTDVLDWSWTSVPASPFSFDYIAAVPVGHRGEQLITSIATAVRDGAAFQVLLQPDPVRVGAGPLLHSADTDRDNRFSLFELLRVIELYNTRNGTTRTGGYQVDPAGIDGFGTNAALASTAVPSLTRYHTADSNRDGRINLGELLRVIELFNYRVGTVRTGSYFARGDTDDGFVGGDAPH
jgi:hypothetical protein